MILVSCFDAFGEDRVNASTVVARVVSQMRSDLEIMELSTDFQAASVLIEKLGRDHPSILIMLGQAGGRVVVTLEMVAINWKEASILDNRGYMATGEKISLTGPVAFFSRLPVKSLVAKLQSEELPVAPSFSAGTFVCNYLFYELMEYAENFKIEIPLGFIHVPYTPQQVVGKSSLASMDPSLSAKVISRIIDLTLEDTAC